MISKLIKFLTHDFIKSSSLVFVVNNFGNLVNYILIIIAIYFIKDGYGQWASTAGVLAILAIPMSSFMAILTRQVSVLNQENPSNIKSYYKAVWLYLQSLYPILLLAFFGCYLGIIFLLKLQNFWLPFLIVVSVILAFISSINQNYLLGLKLIQNYAVTNLANTAGKFVFTLSFLLSGMGVAALPFGIIAGSLSSAIVASLFLSKFFKDQKVNDSYIDEMVVDFKTHLIQGSKSFLYFVFLGLLLNTDIILSRTLLSTEQNNQYGIISTFGQIAHFGPISFAAVIVPFSSGKNHKSIYRMTLLVTVILSLVISLVFGVFGNWILTNLNRADYIPLLPLIIFYSLFILIYNICFVTVNYLISRSSYIVSAWLLGLVAVYILAFYFISTSSFSDSISQISALIASSLFFSLLSFVVLLRQSWREV